MLETHRRSILARILGFFWGPIPWMIEIAGGLSAFARHWEDLTIIVLMLLINAAVGFWEEFKADTAIEALKQRLAPRARVRRDATWKEVDAAELVPGDVVLVRLGNIVPADLELTGDGYLSADQSALTGESLPVTRKAGQSAYSGSVVKTGGLRLVRGAHRLVEGAPRLGLRPRVAGHQQRHEDRSAPLLEARDQAARPPPGARRHVAARAVDPDVTSARNICGGLRRDTRGARPRAQHLRVGTSPLAHSRWNGVCSSEGCRPAHRPSQ